MTNLEYPPIAKELGFMGTVYISYIITKQGTVENVQVMRGIHPFIDNYCVDVIKKQPALLPGRLNEKPVNVWIYRPIKFCLD